MAEILPPKPSFFGLQDWLQSGYGLSSEGLSIAEESLPKAVGATKLRVQPEGANAAHRGQAWQIAEQIRQLIIRGSIAPGVHLGQEELASRFDVSRFPVREALGLLAAESLVVHDLNRGYFVASLSSSEARQLYRLRELVEHDVFGHIEWPSSGELKHLNTLLAALERSGDQKPRMNWSHLHNEFQKAVLSLSPYPVIAREAERLWLLTERYRALLPLEEKSRDGFRMIRRRDILTALEKQDRKALLAAAAQGRNEAAEIVIRILEARGL